jgi:hypothetical protein
LGLKFAAIVDMAIRKKTQIVVADGKSPTWSRGRSRWKATTDSNRWGNPETFDDSAERRQRATHFL